MTVEKRYIYIGEIPYIITENQAKKWFAGCGKVLDIKIDKSRMEIIAHIEHFSEEEAKKALEILNNKKFPKPPIYIKGHWG